MKPEELAAAYLADFRTGAEDSLAFGEVLDACNDLVKGIEVTRALIELAGSDFELAYVAAGPVEDLLNWHGMRAFVLLAADARKSTKARDALAGVWIDDECEAFSAWKALMEKYGLAHSSRERTSSGKRGKSG